MQCACTVLNCQLWCDWLYHTLPQDLINGTMFTKKLLNVKTVLSLSLPICLKQYSFQGESSKYYPKCICLHMKYPLFLSDFNQTWISSRFSKNTQMPNITKICLVGAKLFHAGRQTDRKTYITKLILAFCDFAKLSGLDFIILWVFVIKLAVLNRKK
jgi:hypothetical protein